MDLKPAPSNLDGVATRSKTRDNEKSSDADSTSEEEFDDKLDDDPFQPSDDEKPATIDKHDQNLPNTKKNAPDDESSAHSGFEDPNEVEPWTTFFSNTSLTPEEIAADKEYDKTMQESYNRKKAWKKNVDKNFSIWDVYIEMPVIEDFQETEVPPNKLTRESLELFDVKYGEQKEDDLTAEQVEVLKGEKMEQFIRRSFRKWGWSSEEVHKRSVEYLNTLMANPKLSVFQKESHRLMKKAMNNERSAFRKSLEDEYKFSQPAFVKGVQFNRKKKQFRALMV